MLLFTCLVSCHVLYTQLWKRVNYFIWKSTNFCLILRNLWEFHKYLLRSLSIQLIDVHLWNRCHIMNAWWWISTPSIVFWFAENYISFKISDFELILSKRWQMEVLTLVSVFLTMKWPWGGCCPSWGHPKVTAQTMSVYKTASLDQERETAVLITSWWWWSAGCWWRWWCTSWDQAPWEIIVLKENHRVS